MKEGSGRKEEGFLFQACSMKHKCHAAATLPAAVSFYVMRWYIDFHFVKTIIIMPYARTDNIESPCHLGVTRMPDAAVHASSFPTL